MGRTIVVVFSLPGTPEGLNEHAQAIYPLAAFLPSEADFRGAPPGYGLGVLRQIAPWLKVGGRGTQGE